MVIPGGVHFKLYKNKHLREIKRLFYIYLNKKLLTFIRSWKKSNYICITFQFKVDCTLKTSEMTKIMVFYIWLFL
jgi:hypothetical protein